MKVEDADGFSKPLRLLRKFFGTDYKPYTVFVFIILISGFLITIYINFFKVSEHDEIRKSPNLIAKLSLLNVKEQEVNFHFNVKNDGEASAINVSYFIEIPGLTAFDEIKSNIRTIGIGETITIDNMDKPQPVLDTNSIDLFSIKFFVIYEFNHDNTVCTNRKTWTFDIPIKTLVIGEREPDYSVTDSNFSDDKLQEFLQKRISNINTKDGTIIFKFSEKDCLGKTIFIDTPTKKVYYSPLMRELTYYLFLNKDSLIMINKRVSGNQNDTHTIAITWSFQQRTAELYLDGQK